jgi:folate-binding protein YgfZ
MIPPRRRVDRSVGDVTTEYLALRREVALAHVPRDVVQVRGSDAVTFLQGQVSADVPAIPIGGWAWSLLLAPQGKLDAWVRLWRVADDTVLVDVDAGWADAVVARLERFRLRVDAAVERRDDLQCLALRGPLAHDVDVSDSGAQHQARFDWRGLPAVDLIGTAVRPPADVPTASPTATTNVRIEQGWPVMGRELTTELIPAAAGQWLIDASVSFTKGCYTGQELVARIDSRGSNTPERLLGVVLGDNVLPPDGAAVCHDGEQRGLLTSVGESLDLRAPVALALLHRSVDVGAEVDVELPGGAVAGRVVDLPMLDPVDTGMSGA